MQLTFDPSIADAYTNPSQKIRVLTEDWVGKMVFCPNCGHTDLSHYPNNKPVADFYCENCQEDYELKSKNGTIGTKIIDGAYATMLQRLGSNTNPNFFMLSYNLSSYSVRDFMVVPKHYFIPEIIEKRKPLSDKAQRAGWVGCNILLQSVPNSGKVYFVRDGLITPREAVLSHWGKTLFLRDEQEVSAKGWLLDVMRCIEQLDSTNFNLEDIYRYEHELSVLHPGNAHVKDKIRQQLQILRDKDYLSFDSPGKYHLL